MSQKILITGATGTIGKALVQQLQQAGASYVAGVRDTNKAHDLLGDAVSVVPFDFSDKNSYAGAVQGVDTVFVLGPPLNLALAELVSPFLDFLKNQGILRVVYLSANGADQMGDTLTFHTKIERKLKQDGFHYTILQPSFFAQNFKNYELENIQQRGMLYSPASDGKASFVDVQDIAAVATKTLTEAGHEGKTYVLTGPEALSYANAAQLLTQITGKPIQYPAPTPEEYAHALAAAGAPPFVASYMNDVYGLIRNGKAATLTNHVEQVTGRRPASLQEVLKRDFSAVPA